MDLTNVVTPVNADALGFLLQESEYDEVKTQFLVDGFRNGFSIQYNGPKTVRHFSPNLKIRVGDNIDLWN